MVDDTNWTPMRSLTFSDAILTTSSLLKTLWLIWAASVTDWWCNGQSGSSKVTGLRPASSAIVTGKRRSVTVQITIDK
jgi:hypothetical protein